MKTLKKRKLWIVLLCIVAALCIFAGCTNGTNEHGGETPGGETPGGETPGGETGGYSVTVNPAELTLYRYESAVLQVSVKDATGADAEKAVTWESSDETVLTVSAQGEVMALKAGKAFVTAAAEGEEGSCSVTVLEADFLPALVIAQNDELPLNCGDTFLIVPYVSYNGIRYDDATFDFVSEEEEIFTVAADGTVAAVGVGEARLTVSASWRGLEGDFLTGSLLVKVIENVIVEADESELNLYTTDKNLGDGNTYTKTATLTASVTVNGTADPDAAVVWKSENTSVATVDESTGVVTAVAEGETAVYASYTSDSQKQYDSAPVVVFVRLPVVDKTSSVTLEMSKAAGSNALSADDVFGASSGVSILSIRDVTTADIKTITYSDGGVPGTALSGGNGEAYTWEVGNGEYAFRISVKVYAAIIREAEDLEIFDFMSGNVRFDGTYVLANDIDASGYTHYKQAWGSNYGTNGLRGIFDGRGYTIDGITLRYGGLFGAIGANGVVRNVAFENVKFYNEDNTAVFATYTCAGSVIENVFISVAQWPTDDKVCAPLVCATKPVSGGSVTPVFRNIVIIAEGGEGKAKAGSLMADGAAGNVICECTGIYVVSALPLSVATDTFEGVTRYENAEALAADDNDYSAFGDCWDLTGDYPVFKTVS